MQGYGNEDRSNNGKRLCLTLREKCPYSEFFWSVFSRILTKCGEIRSISSYAVQMWENTNQK